ncbi:MAG: YfhO family protein [Syntrophaceae bacterium]|nr:YfhO family protein [Syntrophaceae bacterium]
MISGLIFMLSGYLLSVHSLLTILLSSVWTPLIMMFFRRAILGRGFKNEIFTALLITLSFLGGGIEIVYGNFLILLIMVAFLPSPCIKSVGDKPRRYRFIHNVPIYWGRIKTLCIVSALFLLLSAVQLLPFIELFHYSIRGNGISYQEATIWSFAPKDFLLFFLPDAYGYFLDMKKYWMTQCWLKTLYTGGLPFILSLLFFLPSRRSSFPSEGGKAMNRLQENRIFYFILVLLSLFLSLGQYNPLYLFVFKYVPFFNGIRYPVKFLYIFILVTSITAGLGFQRWIEWPARGWGKRQKNLFIIFSLISGLLLLWMVIGHHSFEHFLKGKGVDVPNFNYLSVNLHHAKRFLFYLAIFFLLLRVGYELKWKVWVTVLLLVFLVADLFGNLGFYGKEKTVDYFQKTRIIERILSDQGNFRIFSTGKTISLDTPVLIAEASPLDAFKEKHLPSMTLLYQLHNIWGLDVIRLRRIDELYHAMIGAPSISATQLIDLFGIKYIISMTPIDEISRFELIYARIEGLQGEREDLLKENTIKLYKHRNPFPRAWLVKDFKIMNSKAILTEMAKIEFNPGREVLLEEKPEWINPPTPYLLNEGKEGIPKVEPEEIKEPLSGPQNKIEFISETNNRLILQVGTDEKVMLVLSDSYYPGWKAMVDGKVQKIYQANYAFRAIPLNTGTHRIEFIYDPLSFKLGAGVSLLGIFICIVYLLVAGCKCREAPPLNSQH